MIDRTGLILEIFGERAATAEGRLQVELAHLDYQAGRLVRSWTHLERQRGGFGFLGGPGETQIEADRRLIRDRMAKIKRELEQVKRTRGLHRDRRQRAPWPVIALVGYTNAGKSTLFNRLTGRSCVGRGSAVRDARPDHARNPASRASTRRSCRTRSASSPTCRPSWSRRSGRRWRKSRRPTCSPRPRHGASRPRGAARRCRRRARRARAGGGGAAAARSVEQGRPARRRGARRRCSTRRRGATTSCRSRR